MHQRHRLVAAHRSRGPGPLSPRHLEQLLAHPGVEEEHVVGSRLGVMAFHGGNLEVGTDQIAATVAQRTGASLYVIRQPDDLRWHIPSRRFQPSQSERLAAFLDDVDEVVTIHGYGRRTMFTTVLLGGRNRELAGHLGGHLRRTLPHYEIIDDLDHIPRELRGIHAENPVNRPPNHGVQIELPPRVRGNGPFWTGWDGGWPTPHTEDLVAGLVDGLTSWAQGASRSRTQEPSAIR